MYQFKENWPHNCWIISQSSCMSIYWLLFNFFHQHFKVFTRCYRMSGIPTLSPLRGGAAGIRLALPTSSPQGPRSGVLAAPSEPSHWWGCLSGYLQPGKKGSPGVPSALCWQWGGWDGSVCNFWMEWFF